MNICFLIRSLAFGGAERQLIALAKQLATHHQVTIITFYQDNPLSQELDNSNIKLISLDKSGRRDIVMFFYRLIKVVKQIKPDILHGYLEMANLLALFAKPCLKNCKIVWGIRASEIKQTHWLGKLETIMNIKLAKYSDKIIANSDAGKQYLINNGIKQTPIRVIHNGINTDRFQKDHSQANSLRQQLGIPTNAYVLGCVARYHPMKGHQILIKTFKQVQQHYPETHLLCIGEGTHQLQPLLGKHGTVLPAQKNIEAYYQIMNILISPSLFGEGFSNVIAEAMACEVPCIATQVGDATAMITNKHLIVPANNATALANAIISFIKLDQQTQQQIGKQARDHIVKQFSVTTLGNRTESELQQLMT